MKSLKPVLKKILKTVELFIPPILTSIAKNLYMFAKNRPSWKTEIFDFEKKHNKLVILGNGPSLNDSLNCTTELRNNFDVAAVNGFAATNQYCQVKPNLYVLADPAFFYEREQLKSTLNEIVGNIENALIEKTQWTLDVFIPSWARNSVFAREIKTNPNIHVRIYNMVDIVKPINKDNKFNLWDKNYIAFLGQTVLNTCLNLGIALRYDEIYLFGADTSWHENLYVDQNTNAVFRMDTHFYGSRKQYLYSDTYETVPAQLHMELQCIANALNAYWELGEYANSRGVKVYNASAYSNIDAFERRKP